MQIQGPIKIHVIDSTSGQGKELHLTFTDDFQQLDHENRLTEFNEHINILKQQIQATDDLATQQGMMTILQISEELLPHLVDDEIPLDETIVIEIGQTSPFDSLLSGAKLK